MVSRKLSNASFFHSTPAFRRGKWIILGGLWLGIYLLGYEGVWIQLQRMDRNTTGRWSKTDALYMTLQLFTLESNVPVSEPNQPLELQIARVLAPAIAGYTFFVTVALLLEQQLGRMKVRFLKNHVVICGLGDRGWHLAQDMLATHDEVVVIEMDPNSEHAEALDASGGVVVVGDARDATVLRSANAHRARCVVSLCTEDASNLAVASCLKEMSREHVAKGMNEPEVYVHVSDRELGKYYRETVGSAALRNVHFFDIFDSSARALLAEFPPDLYLKEKGDEPHILVVGFGELGKRLVLHAARGCQYGDGRRARITVVDSDASVKKESLLMDFPKIESICSIEFVNGDVQDSRFRTISASVGKTANCAVYVCLDSDEDGIAVSLLLWRELRTSDIPIIVATRQRSCLAWLPARPSSGRGVMAFDVTQSACSQEAILGAVLDKKARSIHEDYVRHRVAEGEVFGEGVLVGWDELPEDLKSANRQQADHLDVKLRAVGCFMDKAGGSNPVNLSDSEIEQMAGMEHQRWVADRTLAGWTQGSPRNNEKRIHPHLVEWVRLPEDIRERDREAVRNILKVIRDMELDVYREAAVTLS